MNEPKTFQDSEYIKTAEEAWQEAIDIAQSEEGWKEEKSDKNTVGWDVLVLKRSICYFKGDTVESRKNSKGRKIYRCKARIEMPARVLIEAMADTDRLTEWNKTLTQAKVLKVLNEECSISYQVRTVRQITWLTSLSIEDDTMIHDVLQLILSR